MQEVKKVIQKKIEYVDSRREQSKEQKKIRANRKYERRKKDLPNKKYTEEMFGKRMNFSYV